MRCLTAAAAAAVDQNEIEITNFRYVHPRETDCVVWQLTDKDKIQRNTKQNRKDTIRKIDVKSLTDKPVRELIINIYLTDRIKKENAIVNEVIKQLRPGNNQFFIEHDKKIIPLK